MSSTTRSVSERALSRVSSRSTTEERAASEVEQVRRGGLSSSDPKCPRDRRGPLSGVSPTVPCPHEAVRPVDLRGEEGPLQPRPAAPRQSSNCDPAHHDDSTHLGPRCRRHCSHRQTVLLLDERRQPLRHSRLRRRTRILRPRRVDPTEAASELPADNGDGARRGSNPADSTPGGTSAFPGTPSRSQRNALRRAAVRWAGQLRRPSARRRARASVRCPACRSASTG